MLNAAAFIAFIRDANRDKYVDPYYTIKKFKEAYALEIAPIPDKDEWIDIQPGEKIYPPIIKRPAGRPRKNRIIAAEQLKRRHKCSKCGGYGHRPKTCKNPESQGFEPYQPSTSKSYGAKVFAIANVANSTPFSTGLQILVCTVVPTGLHFGLQFLGLPTGLEFCQHLICLLVCTSATFSVKLDVSLLKDINDGIGLAGVICIGPYIFCCRASSSSLEEALDRVMLFYQRHSH
ncbi:hypothetical protein Tco_0755492 [Tanacetum coccineum]